MRNVSFLVKPASGACSLRCAYCFYRPAAEGRREKAEGFMTLETAERMLREGFDLVDPGGSVSILFQGGEPTLAGLDFFRAFTDRARALCPARVNLNFSLQTNGMLIDREWAEFLKDNGYLTGLSVDGFKEVHNLHRRDARGEGTWNRVRKTAELLLRSGVETNALCVVTGQCARSPEKAWRELKKLGFSCLQFIACTDPPDAPRGQFPWSLSPEAYGRFLCRIYDLWRSDWLRGEYVSVRFFEDCLRILMGECPGSCAAAGLCGSYFVVEADGRVYPCDFYCTDEWCMGKLGEQSLEEMARGEKAEEFLAWGTVKPAECASCRWRRLCNGGCKNDWLDPRSSSPRNRFCSAFQMFFEHAEQGLKEMARAALAGSAGLRPHP